MVQFSNSVIIKASIEDVFAFLERMDNFPLWNYAVQGVEEITPTDNVVGSRYNLYRNQGMQTFEEVTIEEYIRDKRLVLESKGNYFSYRMIYELISQSENITELVNKTDVQTSGVVNVVFGLLQWNIKKEVNQNLHVLKELLEVNRNKRRFQV